MQLDYSREELPDLPSAQRAERAAEPGKQEMRCTGLAAALADAARARVAPAGLIAAVDAAAVAALSASEVH